jgi:hypothetical protein
MNLLILPGAGDPYHETSIISINLIKEYALKRKFNKIECLSYPGHKSFLNNTELQLEINSTKEVMTKALNKFNDFQEEFIVFVRSYGCNPYLDILANSSIELDFLTKSIVWGSSSYHLIYEGTTNLFDLFYAEGLKRNVKMAKNIFDNTFPIENYVLMKNNYKVFFCTGNKDKYSPKYFYDYLKALNKNKNNHFTDLIIDEKHTISEPNEAYEKLIFD